MQDEIDIKNLLTELKKELKEKYSSEPEFCKDELGNS